ncbi:MAG TPA: transglutaminase domain-containing protein, partial [Flavisolibacter sp.]|nr:transglutaminase domain-containing protein [Flavisolibacter sp.]
MKNCVAFLFTLIISSYCYSQYKKPDFNSIDWNVQFIEASTVDSLALKLTSPYKTDIEKVRAIFSWITQHISYNVNIFNSRRPLNIKYNQVKEDTSSLIKSADEIVAQIVLDRRVAVCDGYARLFKTLCEYSGIQSQIISGFSPDYVSRSRSFRTNHSWNAVMIDSAWRLIDVTWASGFVNYSDDYVQHLDESYFLANPSRFIYDHYPEDPQWSLLPEPPFFNEYKATPFKFKTFA